MKERILLNKKFRGQVIQRCHIQTAHGGKLKTLLEIQNHYVWPGMTKDVDTFISTCPQCATIAPPREASIRGKVPTPSRIWEQWSLDLVGPFPRDQRGRRYILICIDNLSGWPEAFCLPSKQASRVAKCLVDIFAHTSGPLEKWLAELGIRHIRTSPYHPQGNGRVERLNGTIQRKLKLLSRENPRKWSLYLPDVLMAIRTTASTHGPSPYQAVYGQNPLLPRSQAEASRQAPGERLTNVLRLRASLKQAIEASKDAYVNAQPARARQYQEGDKVVLRVLNPKKGEALYQPGYTVVFARGPSLKIMDSEGHELRVHQERVRYVPNASDPETLPPRQPPKRGPTRDLPDSAVQQPVAPAGLGDQGPGPILARRSHTAMAAPLAMGSSPQ